MQRADVTVRLGGDINNTVRKRNVSPAEIVILRAIHGGPDSIQDVQPIMMDKMPHQQERARLAYLYGDKVVDHCFPGAFVQLPVTLKDIAIDAEAVDEDAVLNSEDAPENATGPEPLDEMDQKLVDDVKAAKTRAELHKLAEENEVDLSEVPDKMDEMRKAIITGLFPDYKM